MCVRLYTTKWVKSFNFLLLIYVIISTSDPSGYLLIVSAVVHISNYWSETPKIPWIVRDKVWRSTQAAHELFAKNIDALIRFLSGGWSEQSVIRCIIYVSSK